jgi:hypothetical protein
MLRPPHSPWFDLPDYIWGWVKIMKLPTVQLSPFSRYFFPLNSKYQPSNLRSLYVHKIYVQVNGRKWSWPTSRHCPSCCQVWQKKGLGGWTEMSPSRPLRFTSGARWTGHWNLRFYVDPAEKKSLFLPGIKSRLPRPKPNHHGDWAIPIPFMHTNNENIVLVVHIKQRHMPC